MLPPKGKTVEEGEEAGRLRGRRGHAVVAFPRPSERELHLSSFSASGACQSEVRSLIGVLRVGTGTSSLRIMTRLDFINE